MSHKLYTLGTSQRSSEDFIEILLSFSINAVIDVRGLQKSKLPHFNKDTLSQLLLSNGLVYYFLDFLFRKRRGMGTPPDETGDLRRISNHMPGIVGKFHPDQDISRENFSFRNLPFSLL